MKPPLAQRNRDSRQPQCARIFAFGGSARDRGTGAPKRRLQSRQESRSGAARCERMGRDRRPPTEIARSIAKPSTAARRSRRRERRRSRASPNAVAARTARGAMFSARRRALRPSPMNRERPSTPGAFPIALGDGGRCGGQNSSSSSMNSVGSKGSSSASLKESVPTSSASECCSSSSSLSMIPPTSTAGQQIAPPHLSCPAGLSTRRYRCRSPWTDPVSDCSRPSGRCRCSHRP